MELDIRNPAELPGWLASRFPATEVRAVFFTDERFLQIFDEDSSRDILPRASVYIGSTRYLENVLDRRRFYAFLEQRDLASTPATVESDVDPWSMFPDGFRIRVWRSWDGMQKLPRGQNVLTRADHARWLETAEQAGLRASQWGFQRLLSTAVQDCVSVCGWYDDKVQFFLSTRRLKVRNDNGWLVEAIPDDHGLRRIAATILAELAYRGPFEIEFVRDRDSERFHVIELNPRFWMQHRLAAWLSGNCLVRRYLGWPCDVSMPTDRTKYRWIATDVALARMLSKEGPMVMRSSRAAVWSSPLVGSIGPAVRNIIRGWWRSTAAGLRPKRTPAVESVVRR